MYLVGASTWLHFCWDHAGSKEDAELSSKTCFKIKFHSFTKSPFGIGSAGTKFFWNPLFSFFYRKSPKIEASPKSGGPKINSWGLSYNGNLSENKNLAHKTQKITKVCDLEWKPSKPRHCRKLGAAAGGAMSSCKHGFSGAFGWFSSRMIPIPQESQKPRFKKTDKNRQPYDSMQQLPLAKPVEARGAPAARWRWLAQTGEKRSILAPGCQMVAIDAKWILVPNHFFIFLSAFSKWS